MPRRKKQTDGGWSRKKESGRKQKSNYNPRPNGIFQLMGAWTSPAKKACIVYPPSIPQTPPRGSLTPNKTHFTTPEGSKLKVTHVIRCDDGEARICLPEEKVPDVGITLPDTPSDWLKNSPVTVAAYSSIIDHPFSKKTINAAKKLANANQKKGKDARGTSQNKLMGSYATTALIKAGFDVKPKSAHWAHLLAWAIFGIQEPWNLGIGSAFANAKMELVNGALERLLKGKDIDPNVNLYMSAIPTWVKEYEAIRLLQKITIIVRDGPADNFTRSASIDFDMLSTRPVCDSEIKPFEIILREKFGPILSTLKPSSESEIPKNVEEEVVKVAPLANEKTPLVNAPPSGPKAMQGSSPSKLGTESAVDDILDVFSKTTPFLTQFQPQTVDTGTTFDSPKKSTSENTPTRSRVRKILFN